MSRAARQCALAAGLCAMLFPAAAGADEPIRRNVFLLILNPRIESEGNRPLTDVLGWNDADRLAQQYIADVRDVSHQSVDYAIVKRVEVDDIPVKLDGFRYTDESYLACWQTRQCHEPDQVDYRALLEAYRVCEAANRGEIDELWVFGGPFFGFWESTLAGPGAFWYNSPPLEGTSCRRLLPIMGFSYEREVSEMLEDLGHRVESVMAHVFGGWQPDGRTPWDHFTLRDLDRPGQAQCGNVHFAPNSQSDYDWANPRTVQSACEDWLAYPALAGRFKPMSCQEWGCDGYRYKKWWLSHLPHAAGTTGGTLNDWWRYVVHERDN